MTSPREELTNPPRRLPDLSLPDRATGASTPLRLPGRQSPFLILVHGGGCSECRAFLDDLARHQDLILEWEGRLLAVTSDALEETDSLPAVSALPFPLLSDPEGRVARALSIEAPALVVADQWGQVHQADEATAEHSFPTPSEVVDWARYLAMKCPECEGEAY
jgi:peroxiredoxin